MKEIAERELKRNNELWTIAMRGLTKCSKIDERDIIIELNRLNKDRDKLLIELK